MAIQPPSVESSNDCGKWRSVRPCSRSWSSRPGPVAPGLDQRGARGAVDLEHLVEPPEVERHRTGVPAADPRLDSADDARPSAVRDDRRTAVAAPLEHVADLARVARERDHVGRVVEAPAEGAHDVAVGLPVRVRRAVVSVGRADLGQRGRGLEPRSRELDLVERNRSLDLPVPEAEVIVNATSGSLELIEGGLLVLIPPSPMAAPADCRLPAAGYQCTPRIRCANATPSVDTSASFFVSPFAAELSGNSL